MGSNESGSVTKRPRRSPRPTKDLVELAEDLGTTSARLAMSIRRPLLNENVSFARMRLLGILLDNGPERISQLSYADQVSQPSLTIMVDGMEKLGWVERRPDPRDGRAVLVYLTAKGKAELKRVRGIRSRALAERLAAIPEDKIDDLRAALVALKDLIELIKD